jgi:hypothetical protein
MTMSKDLARAFDPVLMARDAGIWPDDWQGKLLREEPRRALLLCSRQSGKTTVAGLMGLHRALYNSGSLVLIVSPSQRQSGEIFRTVIGFYHKLCRRSRVGGRICFAGRVQEQQPHRRIAGQRKDHPRL